MVQISQDFQLRWLKFIYSEKASKFCKISTVHLTVTTLDKSKVEISQNFVAFSKCVNCIYIKKKNNNMSFINLMFYFLVRNCLCILHCVVKCTECRKSGAPTAKIKDIFQKTLLRCTFSTGGQWGVGRLDNCSPSLTPLTGYR